jgi:flavin reductase (DIM6/NTAB) family NADH-FMN oxidoreductase RutF
VADEVTFHELVAELNYPMVIVTTAHEGVTAGCLVGFSTQCSIHPPRFLVFLSEKNFTFRVASRAEYLAVHFLTPDDAALSELFGEQTGDRVDKFTRCRWRPGPGGVPILEDCPTWFAARIVDLVEAGGDHRGFLLEPVTAGKGRHITQLGFQDVKEMEPGHEP